MQTIRTAIVGVALAVSVLASVASSAHAATPSQVGEPAPLRDKSKSPPTDLANHPKQTLPAVPLAPPAGQSAGGDTFAEDVVVRQQMPNGVVQQTLYLPAPGVTSQQLARRLRKSGLDAQVMTHDDSDGDVAASAGPCSYGTARALQCPPVFWAANGHHDPQVYFVDHTSAQWPTDQAVYTWNQSYGIDSYYRWALCPRYTGTHCVDVWNGNYGATGWIGIAPYAYNTSDRTIAWAYVRFNDYYPADAAKRRKVACHELGHSLGLDHSAAGTGYGCMAPPVSLYPHPDDYALLAAIYG